MTTPRAKKGTRRTATEAQRRANRKNAQRSTGPRTREGKAIASRNAVTHGLLAQDVVLEDEDAQHLQDLRDALRMDLDPRGALANEYGEQIARYLWRLRRAGRIETGMLQREVARDEARQAQYLFERFSSLGKAVADKQGRELALSTSCDAGEDALRHTLRAEVTEARETLATAFTKMTSSHDPLSSLSRYEVSLQRNLSRVLHELRELQARPHGHKREVPTVRERKSATPTRRRRLERRRDG